MSKTKGPKGHTRARKRRASDGHDHGVAGGDRPGSSRSSSPDRLNGEEIAEYIEGVVRSLSDFTDSVSLNRDNCRELWRRILDLISTSLVEDRPVILRNVCTLAPYDKHPHRYRHPTTGVIRVAKPTRHIRLILSPNLKTHLRPQ